MHDDALPDHKLSPGATAVRVELKRVVRELIEGGEWQGVSLCEAVQPAASVGAEAVDAA